jgi:protein-ribulosamine 3-kinase
MAAHEPSDATWLEIAEAIASRLNAPFRIEHRRPVAGGCINNASVIDGRGFRLFVKVNSAQRAAAFDAEADALARLGATGTVRVPRAVGTGVAGDHAWLAMEFLELGNGVADWPRLGRDLAALHRQHSERFGWHRDNTIGTTPQINRWTDEWIDFLRTHRLGYQLQRAAAGGHRGKLLHGDLWSGNAGFLTDGCPVVFDPACYFGDREADLAMTELFGGFPVAFYRAYAEAWPLDPGYRLRGELYKLYHLLNHLNLFGASYLARCETTLETLLAAISGGRSY